ncbi:hypothetical protein, partial [Streptomyces sp. NPDC056683]|uniref:hypothetical protein n=1 Tax=Streptomyces sp. NPDC056683 TaxID=3345910 RepID=UPI0036B3D6A3
SGVLPQPGPIVPGHEGAGEVLEVGRFAGGACLLGAGVDGGRLLGAGSGAARADGDHIGAFAHRTGRG